MIEEMDIVSKIREEDSEENRSAFTACMSKVTDKRATENKHCDLYFSRIKDNSCSRQNEIRRVTMVYTLQHMKILL